MISASRAFCAESRIAAEEGTVTWSWGSWDKLRGSPMVEGSMFVRRVEKMFLEDGAVRSKV